MVAAGVITLFVALLAWVGFGVQKYKAGRLSKAPFVGTGEAASQGEAVAGKKGAISVEGQVDCPELVTSPITATECMYYHLRVTAEWKSGDDSKSVEIMDQKVAAPATLNDGSGAVRLDLGEGGDFEDLETTFDKKKGRGIISTSDSIEFGENGFSVLTGQKINGIRIPDSAKYVVKEECLPLQQSLYANGKINEENAVSSPNWTSLILSSKGREQLVGDTQAFAQKLMYGASAGTAAGAILSVVGALMG